MAALAMNMTYSDKWNLYSMDMIESLQKDLRPHEWWFVQASVLGDNGQAFTFLFPLIAGFLNVVGAKALWAAILVEWSSLILKWIFIGDRPFWWVDTSSVYTASTRPKLRQFFNTCESGPGTPSGHVMMNVAVFYIISQGLIRYVSSSPNRYGIVKKAFACAVTICYVTWVSIVFMSRLYIQAHFLHQCFFGVILGFLIGKRSWNNKWLVRIYKTKCLSITLLLVGTSYVTYTTLLYYGLDPLWSIPLARKYCSNPDLVNINTHPLFFLARFTAATLGLGMALSSRTRRIFLSPNKGFFRTLLVVIAGVLLGRALTMVQDLLPTDQLATYLSGSFLLYFLLPYIVIAILPYIVHSLFPYKL